MHPSSGLLLKLGDCNPGDGCFATSAASSAAAGCEGCEGCEGCDGSDGDVEGDVWGADVNISVALGFPRGRPLGRDAVGAAEAAAGWASVDVVDTSKGFWEGCEGSCGLSKGQWASADDFGLAGGDLFLGLA